MSLLAIVALAYILYRNVYPVPADPFHTFPYLVLGWLALGVAVSS
jgi:predicted membrane channel-forming protein YqfA (hemolysin III family)